MSERVKDQLEIFTGNSNPALAREVCDHLKVKLGEAEVGRFPDGEVMVEVRENVRGGDCFVIQSICSPPNENLMELILVADALRRATGSTNRTSRKLSRPTRFRCAPRRRPN